MRKPIDRRLATILLIVFVQIVGAGMALPILPLYAKNEFAMSEQMVTVLISSFFAAQFLAGPWLGRLSDERGRLPVLIASQIGTAISFVMLAMAQSTDTLFLSRILDGITGGNIIVAQAYVTDITPREDRTSALGLIFAAFGVGFIVGPTLGGILPIFFGPRIPFLFAAAAATATIFITAWALDETVGKEQQAERRDRGRVKVPLRVVLSNRRLALILLIAFVGQFGFGLLQSTFALFGEAVIFPDAPEERVFLYIGLLLATVGLTQLLTQTLLLKRLVSRLGDAWLVVLGSLVRAAGMGVWAVLTAVWMAPLGSVLFAFGMGTMMPPLQSMATKSASDETRGGVLGIYQSAISLAIIFSTGIAGTIFAIQPRLPYAFGALITLGVVPMAVYLAKRPVTTT